MDVTAFLQPLVDLFKQWRVERVSKQTQVKTDMERALKALGKALIKTRVYLRAREDSAPDLGQEVELADLWMDASIALRTVNDQLARNCADKMNYWLDPGSWTEEQIEKTGIDIDRIFKQYADLLGPPPAAGPALLGT